MSQVKETDAHTWEPSEDILVILLARHTHSGEALDLAGEMAQARPQRHVIVDFSRTRVMTSSMLSQLMIVERQLDAHDRKLILCSVPDNILRMFTCVGLRSLFRFAENQEAALESLRSACSTPP